MGGDGKGRNAPRELGVGESVEEQQRFRPAGEDGTLHPSTKRFALFADHVRVSPSEFTSPAVVDVGSADEEAGGGVATDGVGRVDTPIHRYVDARREDLPIAYIPCGTKMRCRGGASPTFSSLRTRETAIAAPRLKSASESTN